MNQYRWSDHRVRSTAVQSTVSRRDRDDARRKLREETDGDNEG